MKAVNFSQRRCLPEQLRRVSRAYFLRDVSRFAMVGLLGTLIDIALFTGLHVVLGMPSITANTLSYSAGIVNNFVWHRCWTFAQRPRKSGTIQFVQFAIVSLGGLLLNNLLVSWFVLAFASLFAHAGYDALAAKICATAVGVCWNFLVNNFWTFRYPKIGGIYK